MGVRRRPWMSLLALLAVLCPTAWSVEAQGLTGQIGGTITDSAKGLLPGATVTIRNEATSTTVTAVTDSNGDFLITNVIAGTYSLTVSLSGFKSYAAKGLVLTATERLSLPPIAMALGGLTETVTVQAESPRIQTQSGERSAVITAGELEDIGLKGRDFMGALQILPGIVDTRNREASGWESVSGMSVNGQASFNFSYDGVTNKDTGQNGANYAAPALDSIAQVKVQSSNFQAEYGRTSGATIVVVTKSGTSKFRGSGAYFKRHEAFNANTWDRRRSCDANPLVNGTPNPNCSKAQYRYNNTAWTIGGPVLMPGTSFNTRRDKLFFFWSQDLLPRHDPGGLRNSTMPTALERMGDFSQTVNSAGQLRYIRDPRLTGTCNVTTGGAACFDGNVIPASLINPLGRTMLNLFPLPNATDPSGTRQYNYQYEAIVEKLRADQVLRVDWNVRRGTTFYSRLQFGKEINGRGFTTNASQLFLNQNYPQMRNSYDIDTFSIVNTLIHTFNQHTVLEVAAGLNYSKQSVYALDQSDLDAVNRSRLLPGFTQFFPSANPLNVIPTINLGGSNALPNTQSIGGFESRYPFHAENPTWDYTANLTKLKGKHNMKAGVFFERVARPAARASSFNGTLSFNSDVNTPFDTNFGFANALLGVVNSYQESNGHPFAKGRFNEIEFFVQDNWRLRRNVTLDMGVRFVHIGPTYVAGQKVAYFDRAAYNPAKAPKLYTPVCPNSAPTCTNTQRVAMNPLTGEILNNTYIGKLVPGSGDFYDGMVVVDGTPPQYTNNAFHPSPRVGFGWDLTGNGQTAIRGGFGVNRDRYGDDQILSLVEQPPLLETYATTRTTLPQLLSSPLQQNPRAVSAFTNFKPATVYNWSVGVQRAFPFKLTGDLAYVGNTNRNVSRTIPINDLSPAQLLDPVNLDPTQANTQGVTTTRRDTDYLRPYIGFAGINERQYFKDGVTYHSIQVSMTRRMSHGLSGTMAYTGTISRGLRSWDWFRSETDNRARNTTAATSRPHNLVFSYNYLIPGVSRVLGKNAIAKAALDGWQVSGVTTMTGGTRGGFSYAFTGAPTQETLTGGLGGSRVVLVCDPNLPRKQRTFDRQFRTECIRPPGPFTSANDPLYQGSALGDEWVQLGFVNHNMTLFKNVAIGRGRTFRVQLEAYNLFNSTQYAAVDTSAVFDFASGLQTDTAFGRVQGVRANSNRVIQLGARFSF
jgi:carboxypeptidase family protein